MNVISYSMLLELLAVICVPSWLNLMATAITYPATNLIFQADPLNRCWVQELCIKGAEWMAHCHRVRHWNGTQNMSHKVPTQFDFAKFLCSNIIIRIGLQKFN